MNTRQTVVVIGAGLGGIVTAARLADAGYQVFVIEKNSTPGGRCGQFTRAGHRFDIGATLFLMPEVFEAAYAALGEKMSDHLDLRRVDPTYRVNFDDGLQITLTGNLMALGEQLEAIEPGSSNELIRYLREGQKHYQVSLDKFVGRNFNSYREYFSLKNLPLLFQLKVLQKHYDNIGNYFADPHLKAAFTFQNMYLGLSPFEAPATYSLLQYTEISDGVWYPMGGLFEVVQSFVKIAEARGVKFLFDSPVEEIIVKGRRAVGVRLADGMKVRADLVVANADLPYVYDKLLPDRLPAWQLMRKKYTCSAIMFYWGVDKVFPQLDMHNIYLAGDYKGSFDQIFKENRLPDEPSFYVHAPARIDAAAAPDGQDSLFVLVPVGHLDEKNPQDWDANVNRARTAVLERLAQEGVVGLEEHIKFEVAKSPVDWAGYLGLAKGAAFGLSHDFWQVGYLRPRNQHSKYKNLYFAGSSTHPGTGLPMVLLSAQLTTERILENAGQQIAGGEETWRPTWRPFGAQLGGG